MSLVPERYFYSLSENGLCRVELDVKAELRGALSPSFSGAPCHAEDLWSQRRLMAYLLVGEARHLTVTCRAHQSHPSSHQQALLNRSVSYPALLLLAH